MRFLRSPFCKWVYANTVNRRAHCHVRFHPCFLGSRPSRNRHSSCWFIGVARRDVFRNAFHDVCPVPFRMATSRLRELLPHTSATLLIIAYGTRDSAPFVLPAIDLDPQLRARSYTSHPTFTPAAVVIGELRFLRHNAGARIRSAILLTDPA